MVVFVFSMSQRKRAYYEGNTYHDVLKVKIVDNIDSEYGQTAQK